MLFITAKPKFSLKNYINIYSYIVLFASDYFRLKNAGLVTILWGDGCIIIYYIQGLHPTSPVINYVMGLTLTLIGFLSRMPLVEQVWDNTVLWNAMIHPLLNMTIKGAIWYQGENIPLGFFSRPKSQLTGSVLFTNR